MLRDCVDLLVALAAAFVSRLSPLSLVRFSLYSSCCSCFISLLPARSSRRIRRPRSGGRQLGFRSCGCSFLCGRFTFYFLSILALIPCLYSLLAAFLPSKHPQLEQEYLQVARDGHLSSPLLLSSISPLSAKRHRPPPFRRCPAYTPPPPTLSALLTPLWPLSNNTNECPSPRLRSCSSWESVSQRWLHGAGRGGAASYAGGK